MFKKTLAAAAVLGAFAGSAFAADVTLYGLVDYGFNYTHTDADKAGVDTESSFQMKAGQNSGSRFGLKGSEDLGNGMKVGFVLENGFAADSGALEYDGRLFGREAQLYVEGDFGKVAFGRVGQLASMNGTYGILGVASPFSSGWGNTVGPKHVMANGFARFDNTITYVTPDFAGFKVHAQYSFKNDGTSKVGDEGKATADRYYGIGATYKAGNLALVGVVDSINYAKSNLGVAGADKGYPDDDSLSVTLGGSYDFEVVKVYALGQWFDNAAKVGAQSANEIEGFDFSKGYFFTGGIEGYGVSLGLSAPAFGGTAKTQLGYMDAECVDDSEYNVKRVSFSVGYDYNLSKRTTVYTAANFTKDDYNHAVSAYDAKPQTYEVMAGMIHRF